MKIGDYVTVQEIADQSVARWVVLADLKFVNYGGYEDVEGGIIRYIANTKSEAGDIWCELPDEGGETLLVCGALDELCVGGVVVE